MRIAIASSSPIAIPYVRAIASSGHELAYIITNPDKHAGRGQEKKPNAFAQMMSSDGFVLHKPESQESLVGVLEADRVDLVLTVAYGFLVGERALSIPTFGWMNAHYSALPRWRGAAPVQYALLSGDQQTALTFFHLEKGMDTGPIYRSIPLDILPEDDTPSLLHKLSEIGAGEIASLVKEIEEGLQPYPQSATGITMAPKISKAAGLIDPHAPVAQSIRQFRALHENPGVYVLFRGQRLRIDAMSSDSHVSREGTVGEIYAIENFLCVCCVDGFLVLQQVTPSGKRTMSGEEFARGARIHGGEPLG